MNLSVCLFLVANEHAELGVHERTDYVEFSALYDVCGVFRCRSENGPFLVCASKKRFPGCCEVAILEVPMQADQIREVGAVAVRMSAFGTNDR